MDSLLCFKNIFVLKTDALAQTEAASFLVPIFHRDKKDIADGWIKLLIPFKLKFIAK
jgi:hypothetical protein